MQLNLALYQPISAIYFALLQCGYEYYSFNRDQQLTEHLRQFANTDMHSFFVDARRTACDVYPFWPRAALLESASFFLTSDMQFFADFKTFKQNVMNASNLMDADRTQIFWEWIADFPKALMQVMRSEAFVQYFEWEKTWLFEQQIKHQTDLIKLRTMLSRCADRYVSPISRVCIVPSPIKCVYSADFHIQDDCLTVVSGALDLTSIVHEFLHTAVHPYLLAHSDAIQNYTRDFAELDSTYHTAGALNAFEEYAVRKLTDCVIKGEYPDLQVILDSIV